MHHDALPPAKHGERRLRAGLDGVAAGLALPALERPAVVGDDHPQTAALPRRSIGGHERQRTSIGPVRMGGCRNASPSRYVCRIICAATWSMTARPCLTLRPLACSAFCAATVVRRSSSRRTSQAVAARSRRRTRAPWRPPALGAVHVARQADDDHADLFLPRRFPRPVPSTALPPPRVRRARGSSRADAPASPGLRQGDAHPRLAQIDPQGARPRRERVGRGTSRCRIRVTAVRGRPWP